MPLPDLNAMSPEEMYAELERRRNRTLVNAANRGIKYREALEEIHAIVCGCVESQDIAKIRSITRPILDAPRNS